MNDIFTGANFGDEFKTRYGRKAIYLGCRIGSNNLHNLVVDLSGEEKSYIVKTYHNNGIIYNYPSDSCNEFDIVSRWGDDDEELIKDTIYKLVEKNFWISTSEGDYDYGEQTINYASDRTCEDNQNVNLYGIVDDYMEIYHEIKRIKKEENNG